MKWEALLAMLGLFLLGLWLVLGPGAYAGLPEPRPGSTLHEVRIGEQRGALEVLVSSDSGDAATFRLLWRNGEATPVFPRDEAERTLGASVVRSALASPPNALFRIFNITSWSSMVWITIGLGGQAAFFGRMALQWIVSERERRSVVPPVFWYLSLAGGVMLFAYFAWRQDIVGVLGQTTGVVIYARNVRLLFKERRRARRRAQQESAASSEALASAGPSTPPGAPSEHSGHP